MDESVGVLVTALNVGEDWEAALFEEVCRLAREWTSQVFEVLDVALYEQEGRALRVEACRSRVLLTRIGAIHVRRRLYRDGNRRRFLLDEVMGWDRAKVLSPSLQTLALGLVAELSYRKAAAVLGHLVSQSVSRMTLHRLVQTIGARTSEQEAAARQGVYEAGEPAPSGLAAADPLFLEADGVSIALQREPERRTELKVAIAYAGSDRSEERRVGKECRL